VIGGRLVGPSLARLQRDQQIGDAVRRTDRAAHAFQLADDDCRRTSQQHVACFEILALARQVLPVSPQRDPELEALNTGRVSPRHLLAVPGSAARAHPFNATIADRAGAGFGIIEAYIAEGEQGDGCDPGMGMNIHLPDRRRIHLKQIEKHKGFEGSSKIGRAHQPHDRTMPIATGAARYLTWTALWSEV